MCPAQQRRVAMPVVLGGRAMAAPCPARELDDLGRLADLVAAGASAFRGFALGTPQCFGSGSNSWSPPPMQQQGSGRRDSRLCRNLTPRCRDNTTQVDWAHVADARPAWSSMPYARVCAAVELRGQLPPQFFQASVLVLGACRKSRALDDLLRPVSMPSTTASYGNDGSALTPLPGKQIRWLRAVPQESRLPEITTCGKASPHDVGVHEGVALPKDRVRKPIGCGTAGFGSVAAGVS